LATTSSTPAKTASPRLPRPGRTSAPVATATGDEHQRAADAPGQQRPEARGVARDVEQHEEDSEPHAGQQGEPERPGRERAVTAGLAADEDDSHQRQCDAHESDAWRPLAHRHPGGEGHDRGAQRGQWRDDAHRSHGQTGVEQQDAESAGHAGGRTDPQRGGRHLRRQERHERQQAERADRLAEQQDAQRGDLARGEPTDEVGHAVGDRRGEREGDDHLSRPHERSRARLRSARRPHRSACWCGTSR
jgi:hypothetical protein